jgi:hypothetical protein
VSKLSSLRAVQRGVNNKPTIKGKRERERDHHPATTIEGDRERDILALRGTLSVSFYRHGGGCWVVGGWVSLSFSLSVSFYVFEGPAKTLAETLVMLPGLAHSHSAGEGRLRKLIVRFLSAYSEGETERPPPNHPDLNDWKGTEREIPTQPRLP